MPTYKTSAVVLGRHNLGEADRIVTFMTPDRGKLRAVARGVRKTLSRQAGHIELFSEAELMLAEGKNLDIITSARLKAYPSNIAADLDRLRQASLVVRMAECLSDDRNPMPGLYRLLIYSLRHLNEHPASSSFELFFKLRLLGQLGYKPQLERCSVCGQPLTPAFMSAEHGGAVCDNCRSEGDTPMSANELGLWRRIYDGDMNALVASDEALALATLGSCDTFYEYIFGRSFVVAA